MVHLVDKPDMNTCFKKKLKHCTLIDLLQVLFAQILIKSIVRRIYSSSLNICIENNYMN